MCRIDVEYLYCTKVDYYCIDRLSVLRIQKHKTIMPGGSGVLLPLNR